MSTATLGKGRFESIRTMQQAWDRMATGGFVPPQDIAFEQSILGAMMLDKSSSNKALELIGSVTEETSPFYRDAHATIYAAMFAIAARREGIDLLTVTNELRAKHKLDEIGGTSYLIELTASVVTGINLDAHVRIVQEKFVLRELTRICEVVKIKAFDGADPFELIGEITEETAALERVRNTGGMKLIGEYNEEAFCAMTEAQSNGGIIGVPYGIRDLDEATLGSEKGEITVFAAETSGGKTALALQMALNNLRVGTPGAMFSLEMKGRMLIHRLWSNLTRIEHKVLRGGLLMSDQWEKVEDARATTGALKLYVNDRQGIRPNEMRSELRRLKRKADIQFVIFDHLQLMQPSSPQQTRERAVSEILVEIRETCKDLDIAGILLCQFNRNVNDRAKAPELWHLKEASAIEQYSGSVIMLWAKPELPEHHVIALIRKGRNSGIGEVPVLFDRRYQLFEEAPPQFPEYEQRDSYTARAESQLQAF